MGSDNVLMKAPTSDDRVRAGAPSRGRYHHGELRTALLDAGDRVLQERGLQGFTLRECARRAGVSHAAPKHHFGDVQGFLTALAARGFDRLHATLCEHLAAAGEDLDEQFLATGRGYAAFALANPEHFRIMFRNDLQGSSDVMMANAKATFVELTNVILRQRGEPELSAATLGDDVQDEGLLNDILIGWCHIHGYAHLRLEGQLDMVPEDVLDDVMKHACYQLAALLRSHARAR